jgi:predicted phage terminase large subunit-like protein
MSPGECPVTAAKIAQHGWRLTPDRLAAYVTRDEPVVAGLGGGFQMSGPYRRAPHLDLIGRTVAVQISRGNGRLIINLPPQTGKSELISRWTPTWVHHMTEGRARVLLGSYESRFAAGWGKKTQDTIRRYGDELLLGVSSSIAARDVWETTTGGGMRTGGIKSAMTGLPGDLIIIDDPFKNFKEAHSPSVRDDVSDWFWAVPMTRLQPGSTVIVLQTRWHEDDLTGRLLKSESADRWTHIAIPALCDDPDTDPLGRQLGESIWPERFSTEHYAAVAKEQGPYRFAGMYQQRPAPLEGELFKRINWVKVNAAPENMLLVRRWDLASGQDEGDYTAGVLMGRHDDEVFVLDVQHERLSPKNVRKLLADTAAADHEKYHGRVRIRVEQEGGSAGKSVGLEMVREVLHGYPVESIRSTGEKFIRALPYAAQQENQNVRLVRDYVEGKGYVEPRWWGEFIEEHSVFPNGANDDMVDAASHAFNDLVELTLQRAPIQIASPTDQPRIADGRPRGTGRIQRPVRRPDRTGGSDDTAPS